jgi:hypothetical protein
VKLFLAPAGLAGIVNAGIAFSVDKNLYAALGALVATVGVTMTVIGWIDRRIDHKLRSKATADRLRTIIILRELSSLRELIGAPPPLQAEALLQAEMIRDDEERKAG